MRTLLLPFALLTLVLSPACAATVQVTWADNSPTTVQKILGPDGTTPLSSADANGTTGTGYALELGYYSQATAANPFAGTWMPVFGKGDANTLFSNASAGDGRSTTDPTDSRFSLTGIIDTSIPGTLVNLPPAGQIMAIRYYNSTSTTGLYYGAAANPGWKWTSPSVIPPVPMSFNLLQGGTVFQGGGLAQTNQRTFTQQLQITSQPGPSSGTVGGKASFTVTATGPGLTYQWYLNGTAIAGATSANYSFTIGDTSAGNYTVTVTDAYGDTTQSGPYTLTVPAAGPAMAVDTPTLPLSAQIVLALALILIAGRAAVSRERRCA